MRLGAGGGPQTTVGGALRLPAGVAVDGAGDVFIACTNGNRVVEVPAGGGPQTTVGSGLSFPAGVAVDGAGDVFIADTDNNRVVEVPAGGGPQTTVASGLFHPGGVAVDGAGDVFIADGGNNRVVEIPVGGGAQTTVGSGLSFPAGVAVDGAGDVFIADQLNNRVVEVQRSQAPTMSFASTQVGGTSSDSPQSVTIQNVGNQPLNAVTPGLVVTGPNFLQVAGSGTPADCASSFSLMPGATCNLSISFEPQSAGSLTSTATFTDNALNAGPSATQSIALQGTGTPGSQTITFTTNAPGTAVYNSSFTVVATGGGSGNPVVLTSAGSCSNSGATYTMTSGTGTCMVIANQAGNSSYSAAPQVTETVNATPASQTITFTQPAPASAAYNSSFMVAATGGASVNPVVFTSSGVCTNSGATFTMTSGTGSCSVIANQSGDGVNYSPAPQVTETVTAVPLSQTITFTTPAPATAKSGDTFTVAATGGASGNPVTFTAGAGSVCTSSGTNGATFTMASNSGTCSVVASQAGNDNYAAAQATETVTAVRVVTKVAPTVSFTGATSSAAYLSTFTVATTENSGITPTITSTTTAICTVSGNVVTMKKGTGTCTVKATWTADTYYLAASRTQSTTATLLGTTTTITSTATLMPANPKKVTVYFTVTNGQNAVTGSVTVTASTGEHCTGTVTGGKCLVTFAATGPNSLTAVYAGNSNDATSTSAAYPLGLPTTTTVSSSPNPSTLNYLISITAIVTSSSGTPTGTVSFASGSTNLGTATLVSGSAEVMTSALPIGSDPITATYNPTGSFAASSGSETQVVTDAITNFSLSNVTQTTATVIWTTSLPSTSQVCIALYPSTTYTCTPEDMNLVTSHSVLVTGLTNNTFYSVYAVGTEGGQSFTGNVLNFRTLR